MTKQSNFGVLICIASFIIYSFAEAGVYHDTSSTGLKCDDCHTIHYTRVGVQEPGGPWPRLLLYQTVNGLCLSCHDGQSSIPDVMTGHSGSHKRAAGAFQEVVGTPTPKGHNLRNSGTDVPPGGSGGITLTCVSCHNPHGNAYYRNLKDDVNGTTGKTVSYNTGVPNNNYSVSVNASAYPGRYDVLNIWYNEPASNPSEYADWCKACHTNFHGTSGETTGPSPTPPWSRHPTAGVDMGTATDVDYLYWSNAARLSRVPVTSADATAGNSDDTPSCMTCHKAHGSDNKYGLIFDNSGTSDLEDGDGATLAGKLSTCQQCHNQ